MVPSFVTEAVKVTLVPEQMVVVAAVIVIVGVTDALTVIAISLEVAVAVVTQLALEVSKQVTLSLFAKVLLVKLAPVPTLLPFTFH